MVAALGGPADFVERAGALLPAAPIIRKVEASRSGFVTGIATRAIGLAVVELGGGRRRPDDPVDPAVGLTGLLPVGAEVRAGDTLALVHARGEGQAGAAIAAVAEAYTIGPSKPPAEKAVIRRIAARE